MQDFFQNESLVVFDTEFTTWPGALDRGWSGAGEHREVVQLAAQKINLSTKEVLSHFECLVRPITNPQLSEYFVTLTGITQVSVDTDGISFAQMLEDFIKWSAGSMKYSYSMAETDYSDAEVLEENIALNNLVVGFPLKEFGNIGKVFKAYGVDTTGYNSGKVYQAFGLDLSGHEHNAMFDVHSLVQSLFALKGQLNE